MLDLTAFKQRILVEVDAHYAGLIAAEIGPLGALHVLKAAQAEAGGGPLVADEADRLAIIANAAAMAERLAPIETERRAVKAAIRAAATLDELRGAILTLPNHKQFSI